MHNKIFEYNDLNFNKIDTFLSEIVDLNDINCQEVNIINKINFFKFQDIPIGSVIIICFSNSKLLIEYFFVALMVGLTPVLISPTTPNRRIIEISKKLGAYALISYKKGMNFIDIKRHELLGNKVLIYFLNGNYKRYNVGDVIMMTSGTSGMMSGCIHTINSLINNAKKHIKSVKLDENDVVLINLPINFSYALVAQVLSSFIVGAKIIIAKVPFSYKNYSEVIDKYSVTSSSLTPYLIRNIITNSYVLPQNLSFLTIGGDFIEPNIVEKLINNNPGKGIYLTYGLTEAGPRVSTLAAHLESKELYSSVGKPLEGVKVSLIYDKTEKEFGELVVNSNTIYKDRVGNVENKERSLKISDFCIRTDDIFSINDDGYLFFKGRKSEFIIVNGEKISLASVKEIVNSYPNVVKSNVRVITGNENVDSYSLDIFVSNYCKSLYEDIKCYIRNALKRSEMPKEINIYDRSKINTYK